MLLADVTHLANRPFSVWLSVRLRSAQSSGAWCGVRIARLYTYDGVLVHDLLAESPFASETAATRPASAPPQRGSATTGSSHRRRVVHTRRARSGRQLSKLQPEEQQRRPQPQQTQIGRPAATRTPASAPADIGCQAPIMQPPGSSASPPPLCCGATWQYEGSELRARPPFDTAATAELHRGVLWLGFNASSVVRNLNIGGRNGSRNGSSVADNEEEAEDRTSGGGGTAGSEIPDAEPIAEGSDGSNATEGTEGADVRGAEIPVGSDGDSAGDEDDDGDSLQRNGEGDSCAATCPVAASSSARALKLPHRPPWTWHPLVLFNRVPKCGSTSLEVIIKRQAAERAFAFVKSTDYVNNTLAPAEQRAFAIRMVELAQQQPTLFDRHMLHLNLSALLPPPASLGLRVHYINLLRDPLQMEVSAFYFWRTCACRTKQTFCRAAWPLARTSPLCTPGYGLDEVYANVTPTPRVGLLSRWFCGHRTECAGLDPQSAAARGAALRRALGTLHEGYVWVGILERLEDSLRLLAKVLPAFFGNLAVERAAREHVRPRTNASAYTYVGPTRATLHKLALENENDVRLYREAVRLLECRLRRCGLQTATAAAGAAGAAAARRSSTTPRLALMSEDRMLPMPVIIANAAATHLLRKRRHLASLDGSSR